MADGATCDVFILYAVTLCKFSCYVNTHHLLLANMNACVHSMSLAELIFDFL